MIEEDGNGQIHIQDQEPRRRPRTSQGARQASRAPQAPFLVHASSYQSERAGSRAPASSRQREVIQATGCAEESTPLGQDSRGRSVSSTRASWASRVRDPHGRSNNFRNRTQAQTDDTEFEELLPREPEGVAYYPQFSTPNGSFVSQYHQSGGPMPLQYGQNVQHHQYHAGSGGTNEYIPGINQGQIPPLQYGNPYYGPTGHDVPNMTPQSHQNPYLQPPHYQSSNGLWQPSGLPYANRQARLIELDPRSNANRSQSTAERSQSDNAAERGSSYDHTVCIWPSHLSVEERHRRGIFTREELRERGMAPPAQPTYRRRPDPAADLSPEERSTASAAGLNPVATNAASADGPDIIDLISHVDHEPEETTVVAVAASDPVCTGLVLKIKGKTAEKRAGSPPAKYSRRPSKKPRLCHGDIYQRPDGTIWFRAPGASVSGKLCSLFHLNDF